MNDFILQVFNMCFAYNIKMNALSDIQIEFYKNTPPPIEFYRNFYINTPPPLEFYINTPPPNWNDVQAHWDNEYIPYTDEEFEQMIESYEIMEDEVQAHWDNEYILYTDEEFEQMIEFYEIMEELCELYLFPPPPTYADIVAQRF
jgi:hypothetical protein